MVTDQQTSDILILEDGQAPPEGTVLPPRQPRWWDTLNYIGDPDRFCRQNLQAYGPIFQTGVFSNTAVFVGSAKAIQMAFNGDMKYTEIALPATTTDMFGEYSLFQRPDLHRQRKSALSAGLAGQALEGYLPHINHVIASGLSEWPNSGKIALYPAVEKISFDILVPLLLGINLDDASKDTFEGLPVSSKAELKALYKTYFDGFYGLLKWKSPFTAYGRGWKARAALIEFMRAVVKKRRDSGSVSDRKADFLSMMLASQQENPDGIFSDALIENQCLLQLWASHYEISGHVASLIYEIGRHPQVAQRLREEQKAIAPGQNLSAFSSQQLKPMVFLEATIKETLRCLPPSSTASRRLTQSVVVDGILYKKGWVLIAEPRIAHAMPEHFQQPDVFEPERFLPPRSEGKLYEFIPFGGGVHACLGAQMAIAVAKVFTSHLLRQFDWHSQGEPQFVQFPLKKIREDYQIAIARRG